MKLHEFNQMMAYITRPARSKPLDAMDDYVRDPEYYHDVMPEMQGMEDTINLDYPMPVQPGMDDPSLRQVELAEGGTPAGKKTEKITRVGKPVYETSEGEMVSEQSRTLKLGNLYYNVPSIHDGKKYTDEQLVELLNKNLISPTSVHSSLEGALDESKFRSSTLFDTEEDYGQQLSAREGSFAEGGVVQREGFSQGSEALEKYSPEMYNKFLEISKKYEGTGVRIVPNIDKGNLFIKITTEPRYKDLRGKDIKLNYRVDKLGEEGLSQIEKNADAIVSNISPEYQKQRSLQVERMQTEAKKKSKTGLYGTRKETVKQINQIVEEVAEGKRPLFDLSKLSRGELLEGSEYKKTTDFLGYDYAKSKPRFLTKKNFKIYQNKIEPYLKSIRTTVSMDKNPIATEEFKNATIDTIEDLRVKYPTVAAYDIPKNVGQHMMKSIERHVDAGGKKFTKISGDNMSNYIFKETSTGKKFSADIVNKNPTNKKWKNYVDVYNNVKDINYNTQFIDKTTGELTTPAEAYRKLTGTSRGVPVEFDHFNELGVFGDPIKNVGISPVTANKAANIPGITEEQLKKGFGRMSNIDLEGNKNRTVKFLQRSLIEQKMNPNFKFKKPLEKLKTIDTRAGEEKIKTTIENIGCPTGSLKAANGANCYIKGAEKIQAGKLNQNEFNVLQKAVKSPAVAKAVKYGGVALKGLGALFAPLMVYDTYTEYKKGKPISEALEYGLLGTNIIGGTRDEMKLTPQEREARGVQQQYEREQQDVSGLSSDFYVPSDLSADQAAKIYKQGQDRVAAERAAEEKQVAGERIYEGGPGISDYSE